jgi:uncharacterized membrane protein
MSDVPVQLIVAAFKDEKAAGEALKALKEASRQKLIKIENAAVLTKDAKGKLHIKETHDMGGGKGAALGGVAGGAIGLIAGAALAAPVAVGALIGGLAAKMRDSGFSDARLKKLGEGLKPGSSAIVAVVEHTWVDTVQKAMAQAGADMVTEALSADVAAQLEAGHDVAYTALATQSGMAVGRVAVGEKEAEGSAVVVTGDEVYAGQFVATEKGFAVHQVDVTAKGAVESMVVGVAGKEKPAEDKPADAKPPA